MKKLQPSAKEEINVLAFEESFVSFADILRLRRLDRGIIPCPCIGYDRGFAEVKDEEEIALINQPYRRSRFEHYFENGPPRNDRNRSGESVGFLYAFKVTTSVSFETIVASGLRSCPMGLPVKK